MSDTKERPALNYTGYLGQTYSVLPKLNTYAYNNNLYVGLDYFDTELGAWLPYTDVTVNVGKLPFLESAIDTNNNGNNIIDFLVKNGFGHLTGAAVPSGYCDFPVFKFDEEKLKEIDSYTFNQYAKAHGKGVRSLDNAINEAKQKSTAEPFDDKNKPKRVSLEETR